MILHVGYEYDFFARWNINPYLEDQSGQYQMTDN